ncbi:hypothetical protein DFH09DRAFT_1070459 [Mycena vulgaris]|nr:hypothetical protein DFH09DRAFT_1070459 [Mycena vulgaris]
MVQNTVERGRDKAAQSVQNSESYEEIGREDQNLPKRVIFLFAPSVLQTAIRQWLRGALSYLSDWLAKAACPAERSLNLAARAWQAWLAAWRDLCSLTPMPHTASTPCAFTVIMSTSPLRPALPTSSTENTKSHTFDIML